MLAFKNGELEITDHEAFDRWLNNPQPKHYNHLNYEDFCVQQAIEKFSQKDPLVVYNFCRQYYWNYCDNYDDFKAKIKERLEVIINLEELIA